MKKCAESARMKLTWPFLLIVQLTFSVPASAQESYPVVRFSPETLVPFDYIFENEGLNRPMAIRVDEKRDLLSVVDRGNSRIYDFTLGGKHIRSIGRRGGGPGDLGSPCFYEFGPDGTRYIYERANQRLSILSPDGDYLSSFRLKGGSDTRFCVTDSGTVVVTPAPDFQHYAVEYSPEGELLREIGDLRFDWSDRSRMLQHFCHGWPAVVGGNVTIVFQSTPFVRSYSPDNILLRETRFVLPEKLKHVEKYIPPEDFKILSSPKANYYTDVVSRDGLLYLMIRTSPGTQVEEDSNDNVRYFREVEYCIYVLDEDLHIQRKVLLQFGDRLFVVTKGVIFNRIYFDPGADGGVFYVSCPTSAEILKFTVKK